MNRNIKFRAWDIPTKRMLPVVNLQFRLDYREDLNGAVSGVDVQVDGSETLSNWELMQFTGLLDKNGVEIYEGDIIERKNVFIERSVVKFGIQDIDDNEGYSYNTVSGFYLNLIYQYGNYADGRLYSQVCNNFTHMDKLNEAEVIGNIYENPELLMPNNGGVYE